jgi:hypothetical protein
MCPCQPLSESNFHPPAPPAGTTGFAPTLPNLNIQNPPISLPDLTGLFNTLSLILPSGGLKPNLDADVANKPFSAFLSLLEQCMPFLMLYKFFLPVLNLILCIIEVLCAIPNPFKLPRALSRLFRVCLPEFVSLFPFLALIVIITTLLLLVLALIEYVIQRIANIIQTIIQNIKILSLAVKRLDNNTIIAITRKIGDLLCLLQDLFVVFGIILLIVELIKGMIGQSFDIPPCSSSDGSADGCCTSDVCPAFIKNNATNGITSSTGFFQYYPQVGLSVSLPSGFPSEFQALFAGLSAVRQESWQFYDPNLVQDQQFYNITHAFDLPAGNNTVFFPSGATYNDTTDPTNVPYTINFRLFYNPQELGLTTYGEPRYIRITNAIVKAPPTKGVLSYDGKTYIAPFDGTLNLVGGYITEDDGITPIVDPNGNKATIDEVFHSPPIYISSGETPPNIGVLYSDITYTFNINPGALLPLITIGCMPTIAVNRDFINTTLGGLFNSTGVNLANALATSPLPDVATAQACIADNVANFRENMSIETANNLQTNIMACLTTLQNQTTACLTGVIGAGYNQYQSSFELDTTIQFTTRPIIITATINENSGQNTSTGIPASVGESIAANLQAVVSLGEVSQFTYDGYSAYTAIISSTVAGNGTVKVAFNNTYISTLNNPASIDEMPSIAIDLLNYTFVEAPAIATGEPRRDPADIARDNGG